MAIQVQVPSPLRKLTDNQVRVLVEGQSVRDVLDQLASQFPGISERIYDKDGSVRPFINVYLNGEDIRFLNGLETRVKDGDEIGILPAMAGGAMILTPEQVKRYSRHIIMEEVGNQGQKALLNSKVLMVGAGGLGCPAALYLAAAGVGTLGIVDFDVVDLSNLQRQILHHVHDIGRPKVVSAEETIAEINPDVKVVPYQLALSSDNVMEIIKDYDVVVNGCDNFATRYLMSDACYFAGKPLVDASILRFEGQATVFVPGSGCYRCLFPSPPPPGAMPSCAEAGVLGVLPGIMGSIQAVETIKLLLGLGEPLIGRLLTFDALAMEFREFKMRRNPQCAVCGDTPTITELIDYEVFCGAGPLPAQRVEEEEIPTPAITHSR